MAKHHRKATHRKATHRNVTPKKSEPLVEQNGTIPVEGGEGQDKSNGTLPRRALMLSAAAGVGAAAASLAGSEPASAKDLSPLEIGTTNDATFQTVLWNTQGNALLGIAVGLSEVGVPQAGLMGDSNTSDGIFGCSSVTNGVYGVSVGYSGLSTYYQQAIAGVLGDSSTNDGVVGLSSVANGVRGITTGDGSGVSGVSVAPSGFLYSDYLYPGVKGDSNSHDGVTGLSSAGNGVSGYSAAYGGSGVYGKDVSADGGFGVNGNTVSGYLPVPGFTAWATRSRSTALRRSRERPGVDSGRPSIGGPPQRRSSRPRASCWPPCRTTSWTRTRSLSTSWPWFPISVVTRSRSI